MITGSVHPTDAIGMEPPALQSTIPGVFFDQARHRGEAAYLHFFRDGEWRAMSWAETAERAVRVACALLSEGLRIGDHVVVMAPNRPEWLYCDLGILAAGGVTVPIYPSVVPKVAHFISEDSNATIAIVDGDEMSAKLSGGPYPARIFTMEDDVPRWTSTEPEAELRAQVAERLLRLDPHDVATVSYTSGTTGDPKGVMLSHRNFVETAKAALQMFRIGPQDELLSYLPYSHVLERIDGIFIETMAGCSFWLARSLDTLLEDIQVARPTIMLGVPRVFEKVYEAVQDQVRAQALHKRAIFRWAIGIGAARLHRNPGLWLRIRIRVAERLVLKALRQRLTGGRLRFFISGGAPLNEKVEEFFWAIGVKILQGWGLTETTSGVTTNTEEVHRYKTVGIPFPGTEIHIADDGEILVKGPGVMLGYKNRPEASAEMISHGWLKTGDMGFVDQNGFLTITDRKKDLIKTSGGKYVAPLPIESQLESDRYVKSSIVIGDERPYVVALIVPDWAAFTGDTGISGGTSELANDPRVLSHFAATVSEVNRGLASFETVKYFALLERDFSEPEGELTPTLKKKRRVITQHFEAEIEALYGAHKKDGRKS
jgi:long-chain acyl-CoA synthetase